MTLDPEQFAFKGGGDAVPTKHSKVDTAGFWDFGSNRLDVGSMRNELEGLRTERVALRAVVEQLRNEISNLKAKVARRDKKIVTLQRTRLEQMHRLVTVPNTPQHPLAPQRAPIEED